jgi:hypothetical protein
VLLRSRIGSSMVDVSCLPARIPLDRRAASYRREDSQQTARVYHRLRVPVGGLRGTRQGSYRVIHAGSGCVSVARGCACTTRRVGDKGHIIEMRDMPVPVKHDRATAVGSATEPAQSPTLRSLVLPLCQHARISRIATRFPSLTAKPADSAVNRRGRPDRHVVISRGAKKPARFASVPHADEPFATKLKLSPSARAQPGPRRRAAGSRP